MGHLSPLYGECEGLYFVAKAEVCVSGQIPRGGGLSSTWDALRTCGYQGQDSMCDGIEER